MDITPEQLEIHINNTSHINSEIELDRQITNYNKSLTNGNIDNNDTITNLIDDALRIQNIIHESNGDHDDNKNARTKIDKVLELLRRKHSSNHLHSLLRNARRPMPERRGGKSKSKNGKRNKSNKNKSKRNKKS